MQVQTHENVIDIVKPFIRRATATTKLKFATRIACIAYKYYRINVKTVLWNSEYLNSVSTIFENSMLFSAGTNLTNKLLCVCNQLNLNWPGFFFLFYSSSSCVSMVLKTYWRMVNL